MVKIKSNENKNQTMPAHVRRTPCLRKINGGIDSRSVVRWCVHATVCVNFEKKSVGMPAGEVIVVPT